MPRRRRGRGRGGGGGQGGGGSGPGAPSGSSPPSPPTAFSSVAPPATSIQAAPSLVASPAGPPTLALASCDSSVASSSALPLVSDSTSAAPLSREIDDKLTLLQVPAPLQFPFTFPKRPGYGTIGKRIAVRANHFLVEVADRDLHHYAVSITPEVTSKKINRVIINQLVNLYKESHLGNRSPAYDGWNNLYTAGPLPFLSMDFVIKLIENDDHRASSSCSVRKEYRFIVTIKFISRADIHHLRQFLSGRQLDAPQETIQAISVVLKATSSEKYNVVGRSFFHPELGRMGELAGNGIDYWRGYYQSLRLTQMGLSLCIDVSVQPFYEPILVIEFLAKHFNFHFSSSMPDQDRQKINKALRGVQIEVTHREYFKSHKVTGITTQPTSELMFTLGDKKTKKSVTEYFYDKYNIALQNLPALQAGSDAKPIYLPIELCKIAAGQRYFKRLNERQVINLLRATCQRPQERENRIKEMVGKNNFNGSSLVNTEFGIQVRDEHSLVDARVLPSPMLLYHNTGIKQREQPRMGQWNMINKRMINGGRVEFWTCVNFSKRVKRDLQFEFCDQLINMCSSKGMVFNPNPLLPIHSACSSQVEMALRDIHKQCVAKFKEIGQAGKQLQLLIIILPDFIGSYGQIKRVCETELGIVSQCCQPCRASKLNMQYLENMALKVNVKVGGRNTVLNDAIQRNIPLVTDRPTIVLGAGVTHPQPGDDSSPSIAAVVASMDWPEVTKYRGVFSAQPPREEIIHDLYASLQDPQRGLVHGGMIRELLIAFRKSTNQKPHRIIFYRDGVSEGQFSHVLLYEIDAIRKACLSLEDGYLPPVTFVVVRKGHHNTRLFPADHTNRDQIHQSGNILPGTVVDTQICHPTEFDFYLNSHAGIQGTSRPAHYHVLYDENSFNADSLQMLTNNLCYTYARCTRSVSIVPPVYYAHLAAVRARYYIEGETLNSGSTSGSENRVGIRPLPLIKDNVKDVMFYC